MYQHTIYHNFAKHKVLYNLVPLLLLAFCPIFVMLIWHINANLSGSFYNFFFELQHKGLLPILQEVWFSRFFGSSTAWKIVGIFALSQLLLMRFLPGKTYVGSLTPKGNLPVYKNNGLLSYLISYGLFFGFSLVIPLFSPSIIYDHFGDILAVLNLTALLFCLLLYVKGKYFPSSSDHSSSGHVIFDYYWGTELYPRIFGWDVKQFTNCRFGMTGWSLTVVSFAFAQRDIHGTADWSIIVSASLIAIYLLKFFIWESGYMRSMDIIVDRAGFYICWGCLVWVPAVYTSPVMFMVQHPVGLPFWVAGLLFSLGLVAIFINYWADWQRQMVRSNDGKANGNIKIWGKPVVLIRAYYVTANKQKKSNLLLASGFWGISRHFHYLPEITAAFIWSATTGFGYFMPFFYVMFLTILLIHRAFRDDKKCQKKYGRYWDEYKKKVPYKIIPYII